MVTPPIAPTRSSGSAAIPTLLWPCIGLLVGTALGPARHDLWTRLLLLGLVALILAGLARSGAAVLAAITLLACALGLGRAAPVSPTAILWPEDTVDAVRATVTTWPTAHSERVQVPLDVFAARTVRGWQPARLTLRATLPNYPTLQRGDVVVVGGSAAVRRNWWRDADGTFYGQWVRTERIEDASSLTDVRSRARARFIAGIDRFVRAPESGLTAGMLLGEKSVIDNETRDALARTGTTQHVVISGWNIALVIGLFAVVGRSTALRRRYLWFTVSVCAIALYTFAVGAEPTVLRAALMGGGGLIAPLLGRRADPLVWLGIASAMLALANPTVVRDLSFLLSCAATFGVLVVAPWLARQAHRFSFARAVPHGTELLSVAIGAQVMTEPLIWHAFGRVSLISPFVNLLVEPLVPIIMALGCATVVLSFAPWAGFAMVAGGCTAVPAWLFLTIIGIASRFPLAALTLPQPGLTLTMLIYAIPAVVALGVTHLRPTLRRTVDQIAPGDGLRYTACFILILVITLGAVSWLS